MAYIRTPIDNQFRNTKQCRSSPRCIVVALSISFIAFNWIVFHIFKGQTDDTLQNNNKGKHPLSQDSDKPLPTNLLHTATEHQLGYKADPAWLGQWYRWRAINPSNKDRTTEDSTKHDIVYTWVNGSDPLFTDMRVEAQKQHPMFQKVLRDNPKRIGVRTAMRYRDMDELRYSFRSVMDYASHLFRHIHIVTADVGPETQQTPAWLNLQGDSPFRMVGHRSIFTNSSHLPSFNSLSIESHLIDIPDLTDIFLYLNDDIFLGKDLLPSDVWTPLYGYVFHMEASLLVPPTVRFFEPDAFEVGEWHSLQYSNYLLSQRFGPRHRAYIAHVIHVLSVSMLKEIQAIWPDEFIATSAHQFRGEGLGRDIHASFMMAHYVMERLRETQLESFWHYQLDRNQDGILDSKERARLIDMVREWNLNQDQPPQSRAHLIRPTSIQGHKAILSSIGIRMSGTTAYRQAGLDGYPFLLKDADTSKTIPLVSYKDKDGKNRNPQVPYMSYEKPQDRRCKLDLDFCFGHDFVDLTYETLPAEQSKRIFNRLAFKEFHCGDCLLEMLMQYPRGNGGMGAWMPADETSEAFASVVKKVERYNYVLGTSDYTFIALQSVTGAKKGLDGILSAWDNKAFFCINDDYPDDPVMEDQIQGIFKSFLDTRFTIASPWENDS
ncbi:MAG: hypothetical protein J3R72DRAFT_497748 [Linnemannia gamsii]|nr:MAG: hypothetical protein J3R72DRAFT_497748 [Linnemannia gamsii]